MPRRNLLHRGPVLGPFPSEIEDVTGTTYVHTSPDAGENYYWVVACNSGGCSEIDSENPATPLVAKPSQPANVWYALDGSTIRVSC